MGSFRRVVAFVAAAVLIPACSPPPPPKTLLSLPDAPTALVADPRSSARVDLAWTDNAANEAEYRIWRRDAPGAPFVLIATISPNSTAYADLGLEPSTTYAYQVTAANARGESPVAGPVSVQTRDLLWSGPDTTGPFQGRAQHAAIYDAGNQRMIVFGGYDVLLDLMNDTYQYDLSQDTPGPWAPLATTGTPPPPLFGHSAVYDSRHKRMIVFGGQALRTLPTIPPQDVLALENAVYVLDLDPLSPTYLAWSAPGTTGPKPSPREAHTAVYDPANQAMVIYGGYDGTFELDDGAVLFLTASGPMPWGALLPSGPVRRQMHASLYDPLGARMITFGGQDTNSADGSLLNKETWALSLGAVRSWRNLDSLGTPGFRMGPSAVYDSINQRMVVFGGAVNTAMTMSGELWGLQTAETAPWRRLPPTSPSSAPGRQLHTAVYDPAHGRMVIYGGLNDNSDTLEDLWVLQF